MLDSRLYLTRSGKEIESDLAENGRIAVEMFSLIRNTGSTERGHI